MTRRPRRNSLPSFGERHADPLTGPTQVGGRKVSQLANKEIGTCLIGSVSGPGLDPCRGKLRPERVSAWRERASLKRERGHRCRRTARGVGEASRPHLAQRAIARGHLTPPPKGGCRTCFVSPISLRAGTPTTPHVGAPRVTHAQAAGSALSIAAGGGAWAWVLSTGD